MSANAGLDPSQDEGEQGSSGNRERERYREARSQAKKSGRIVGSRLHRAPYQHQSYQLQNDYDPEIRIGASISTLNLRGMTAEPGRSAIKRGPPQVFEKVIGGDRHGSECEHEAGKTGSHEPDCTRTSGSQNACPAASRRREFCEIGEKSCSSM